MSDLQQCAECCRCNPGTSGGKKHAIDPRHDRGCPPNGEGQCTPTEKSGTERRSAISQRNGREMAVGDRTILQLIVCRANDLHSCASNTCH